MSTKYPMLPPAADVHDSSIPQSPPGDRPDERPLSESRKPAERGARIIDFAAARRVSPARESTEPFEPRVTGRQRAGRQRNPLRHYHSEAAGAVTIAGKLHRGEPLRADGMFDEIKWLRRGAEAARILADELARLVEQEC